MGTKTINPVTPALTGAAVTKTATGGSTGTILVAATTTQNILDFSKLAIVIENLATTASIVATIKKGVAFSEIGQGDAAAITILAGTTRIIGGASFESARFQNATDKVEIGITSTATAYVYAIMGPGNQLN
jgi:hypothetical protein